MDLQKQIKTSRFQILRSFTKTQHQWSNQSTLEANIGVAAWWQSEHDATIICVCCPSSSKENWQEEYLLITRRWVFRSRSLNRLELSGRGWEGPPDIFHLVTTSGIWWSLKSPPSFVSVCVCDSWIRKWRVWCISDWIQIIYQTWSKIFIRLDLNLDLSDLDPRYASDSEPGRVSGSIWLRDNWPLCHVASPRANAKAFSDMWRISRHVTICHDIPCHMSRDSLREREPDHSSWYLLSLTLVIGCVTVEELFELRLYINMNVIIPSIILRDESLLIT